MEEQFTKEEFEYLLAVFNTPSVNPLQANAIKIVELTQSIMQKAQRMTEQPDEQKQSAS